jgi:hypothetical protein
MRAMQKTTDALPDEYNEAAKQSKNAKIDPTGELKLLQLVRKVHYFCDDNDMPRMIHADGCKCHLRRPVNTRDKTKDLPYSTVDDFPHCGGPWTEKFFAERGLRLAFANNADEVVQGVATAPVHAP